MTHFECPFDFNEIELQRVYKKHQRHGLVDDLAYADFKNEIKLKLSDTLRILFSIIPKAPHLAEVFYNNLSDEEFDMVSGLANLAGYTPHNFPIALNTDIAPDIRVEEKCGILFLSCFENNSLDVVDFTQDAVRYYWHNFDVKNIESLTDEEQLCLIRNLDLLSGELKKRDQERHKKLVFGLNIPQGYKDFHRNCIDELKTRILVSPVYAGIFGSILEKQISADVGLPYLKSPKDKDIFSSILMHDMAQIWGIPTPIRKDFTQEGAKDATGQTFTPVMHAYYLPRGNKERLPGLYYGFNTMTGVMRAQNYYELKYLAHEFAHLVSVHLTNAQHNKKIYALYPELQKSPILSLSRLSAVFQTNSPSNIHKRYYSQIGNYFTGLPHPEGHKEYKGQLEERHADWLGQKIADAVQIAVRSWQSVRNIHRARDVILDEFKPIFRNLKLREKAPKLMQSITHDIESAEDFPAFIKATRTGIKELKAWYKKNINEQYERDFAVNNATCSTLVAMTPNIMARQQLRDLSKSSEELFSCYPLYERAKNQKSINNPSNPPLPLDENGLFESP